MTLHRLSQDLLADMDAEHVAAVREALKDKRVPLSEKLAMLGVRRYRESDKAASNFIEARKLRSMLMFAPFSLSEDQVSSVMRFLGVKSEDGDSVRVPEIMRSFCPALDQNIFTMINSKVLEKYGSLKTAFDSKGGSKNGKISRQQLAELLRELPLESKLSLGEEQDLISLADADGSGSIEYQEFQIIFGTGEMLSRTRQENYKKLQNKGAQIAAVRTDSISSSETPTSTLGPEERVAEVILGPRIDELRSALKEADQEGKGTLDEHTLHCAFNKLGLGLSTQDISTLLSKTLTSSKAPVDYSKFLERVRERISMARTIEEAEAEIVEALRDLLQRRGEGKLWLVKAFQIIDGDLNAGKCKGKIASSQLAKTLASFRVALSSNLVTKLIKAADSDRKDGVVNYADFVRMLGTSSSKLRGLSDGTPLRRRLSVASPAAGASPAAHSPTAAGTGGSLSFPPASGVESASVDDLSDEMEEEIREVIKGKYETMTNAFRNFDKTNKGSITREQMLDGLKVIIYSTFTLTQSD
jgi:Ca2+-binding EF-hand superfamily protein